MPQPHESVDVPKQYAIASIQRDRAPWILEWIAFHMAVGFNRFYIYSHRCTDGMTELLLRLSRHHPVVVHPIEVPLRPQLVAYQHAWNAYGGDVDWMAFIDGDEFLFPTRTETIGEALVTYEREPLSALAAYWMCYGSSGHLAEPEGLVWENYTRHAEAGFLPNRHVKSILRGRQGPLTVTGSHVFSTRQGTFDETLRPVDRGWMQTLEPSYGTLRINHYAVQSYDFFKRTKQTMGAADGNPSLVRPDAWFREYDRNECDDGIRYRFLLRLRLKLRELQASLREE